MPSTATCVSQQLAILKTVFLMSLTVLVIIMIVQFVRMSPFPESPMTREVAGFEKEMLGSVGSRRVERELIPFEATPSSNPQTTTAERKHRKHKHRKSKVKKRKPRSRRSNNGNRIRDQVRELRQRLQETRQQIAQMNQSLLSLSQIETMLSEGRVGVHLTYTHASQNSLLHEGAFVWTLMDREPGYHFFNYSRSPNQASGRDIVGVKIRFPGQYLVYSQILINGRDQIQYMPHDCAHETVLFRHNIFQRQLLVSYITQNGLGLAFGSDSSGNDGDPSLRPKDTSLQMGIFYLRRHEEIRIRIPTACNHFYYSGDPHGSYFGLMRL